MKRCDALTVIQVVTDARDWPPGAAAVTGVEYDTSGLCDLVLPCSHSNRAVWITRSDGTREPRHGGALTAAILQTYYTGTCDAHIRSVVDTDVNQIMCDYDAGERSTLRLKREQSRHSI